MKGKKFFTRSHWLKPRSASSDQSSVWIQEQGGALHPAFATAAQYDEDEKRFVPHEKLAIEYLEQLLRNHDARLPEEPKFHECSWEVVLETLSQTKAIYSSRSHFGQRAGMGMDLTLGVVDTLPDEYGLGVIKGVLALVFQSAKRSIENAAKILAAFENIPETIITINVGCKYLKPTTGDLELKDEFYSTLVKGMPLLIDVLLGKQLWYQNIKAFLTLRIQETAAVDEVLAEWNGMVSSFEQRIARMRDKVLGETYQQGIVTHEKLGDIQSVLGLLCNAVMTLEKQSNSNTSQCVNSWYRAQEPGAQAMTALRHELQAFVRQVRIQHEDFDRLRIENATLNESIRIRASKKWDSIPTINQLELLGIMGIPPGAAWNDLNLVLRQACKFDSRMLGRSQWLVRRDEFIEWFGMPQPSILLVEGYLSISPTTDVTPMSVFNSNFISSLINSSSCLVLYFFAGLHDSQHGGSKMDGPVGLIRSLVTQLLSSNKLPQPSLHSLDEDRIAACVEADIRALCGLFEDLLRQVHPAIQVICILDGLVSYESPPWDRDLLYVVSMLEHIVRVNSEQMPVLKVLMTFAHHSLLVSDRVGNPDVWKYICLSAGQVDAIPTMFTP